MKPEDDNKKESSMELPAPVESVQNIQGYQNEGSENLPNTEEGHAKALELGMSKQAPQGSVADDGSAGNDPLGIAHDISNDSSQSSQSTLQGSMPAIADDNDLIEKEWVEKAKQIVEKTKDDPYNQNREVGKMRADYLKKRYNKEIKLVE